MINRWLLLLATITAANLTAGSGASASPTGATLDDRQWVGTWAAAPQAARAADARRFQNQTIRLIVHTSAAGNTLRIKLSNAFGEQPLAIGSAHVARRSAAADIDAASDRPVTFGGQRSVAVAPRSVIASDPVELDAPALSDLAISLFLPQPTVAITHHSLALQTNYVGAEPGDHTADTRFAVATTMRLWPFLSGVDVAAPRGSAAIVAFGSSTTDGDGSTADANRRWPDVLAERLYKSSRSNSALGVLNEGIIGNRLLNDSPRQPDSPFGPLLGESGLARFDRDVLFQSGVKYVFICLGVNDILFPGFPFTPSSESVTVADLVSGYQILIARARKAGIRVVGTTIPPFEGATFDAAGLKISFYTADRERTRQAVNDWIRNSHAFDAVVDFDLAVRDPTRPTRLLPAYAAPDHLHVNDAGNVAQGYAIRLTLFGR